MSHKVFIPITDEMLYDYPELITTPLRPYQIGNPCYHWMATIESSEQNGQNQVESVRYFDHRMVLNARNRLWPTRYFKRIQDWRKRRSTILGRHLQN